jgi:hypothetical protein
MRMECEEEGKSAGSLAKSKSAQCIVPSWICSRGHPDRSARVSCRRTAKGFWLASCATSVAEINCRGS